MTLNDRASSAEMNTVNDELKTLKEGNVAREGR